jgi:hypothetical protein
MERKTAIAEGLLTCKFLLSRYLKGFDDTNHTRQAPGLPNHAAWTLGHCSLTMHRIAEHFGAGPLPATDFTEGSAANDRERFGTETVCFNSPAPAPGSVWPPLQRCVAIYEGAVDRLAEALRASDDAKLDTMIKWGTTQIPLYQACQRMMFHNGMHTGQIADLRRALGMGSIM